MEPRDGVKRQFVSNERSGNNMRPLDESISTEKRSFIRCRRFLDNLGTSEPWPIEEFEYSLPSCLALGSGFSPEDRIFWRNVRY